MPELWGVSGVGNLFNPGVMPGQPPVYTPITNPYNPPAVSAPSVGLAWSCRPAKDFGRASPASTPGASVLRGGYTIATVREGMGVFNAIYGQNQGLTQSIRISPTTYPTDLRSAGQRGVQRSAICLRGIPLIPATPSYPIAALSGNSVYGIDPNLKMGYVQSWNISLQRELDQQYRGRFPLYRQPRHRPLARDEPQRDQHPFTTAISRSSKRPQNNLAIARGGNIYNNTGVINFGNQGLPGQVNIPMISTALGNHHRRHHSRLSDAGPSWHGCQCHRHQCDPHGSSDRGRISAEPLPGEPAQRRHR